MIQIIPAILATTEKEYSKFTDKVNSSSLTGIDWIHIDYMDNKFVQNKSIGPDIIAKCKPESSLKIEAHLMVINPFEWLDQLRSADVSRVISHIEVGEREIRSFIDKAKTLNLKVGLAINPETPVSALEPFLDEVDTVLVMGVHPGFQGQKFIPETLEKIIELSSRRSLSHFKIGVDGGISEENARQVVEAGADYLVIGSNLFKYDNLKEGLEKIWEVLRG